MSKIAINRAPVLTLWAAVVAERLGHSRETALSLGKAIAGKTAFSKAQTIGRAKKRDPAVAPPVKARDETVRLYAFMGRNCTMIDTALGPLAMHDGSPVAPSSVETYLAEKFGEQLPAARGAMETLARSRSPAQLARSAFSLYEKFRPAIAPGNAGWGKDGVLDLAIIEQMAKPRGARA